MLYVRKITKEMGRVVRKKTCVVCLAPLRRVSRKEYYCKFCGNRYIFGRYGERGVIFA
jgi:homoaconitase/3-isopropylmalate dehydratase large subunit